MKKQPPHEMSACRRCEGVPKMEYRHDFERRITWHWVQCAKCGTRSGVRETIWQAYEDWEDMQF